MLGITRDRQMTELGSKRAIAYCGHKKRLQDEFIEAAHNVSRLVSQQVQALIEGHPDFSRFDVLIHMAQEDKEMAKYAWMSHVDSHHCEEG
jgi:hypothetical protein